MKIVVGCPVTNRAWVLPSWFDAVERAFAKAEVEPVFEFVCGTSVDGTEELLQSLVAGRGRITLEEEDPVMGKNRVWNPGRYATMVSVRNRLLEGVREEAPDFFLSLDSDILLHEDALVNMLDTASRFDAVGGKCYMMPPPGKIPSYCNFSRANSLLRPDHNGIIKVHVIMAIKLMGRAAYAIDYETHPHGEDLGWSIACRQAGLKLGWDGRICSKHIVEEWMLNTMDKRVGY